MTGLNELIEQAKKLVDHMTPEDREAMFKAQRESWVRAEASWPKAKFHYEGTTKVYDSYEDYLND